ncbi:MAG: protein-disulfide reductase DsbD domain-containing protein [Pseudomonadota bacterium]
MFKVLAVAGVMLPSAAMAQSQMALLAGWALPEGGRMIGVEVQLDPGWKTYWRVPGAGGIPPLFDWSASENLGTAQVHWPAPEVFRENGMVSFGYRDRVVFPVELLPARPDQPIEVGLTLDYGVCEAVCVPVQESGRLGPEPDGTLAASFDIEDALAARPTSAGDAGIVSVACMIDAPDRMTALLTFDSFPPDSSVPVFESGDPTLSILPDTMAATADTLTISARIAPRGAGPSTLGDVRLTLLAPSFAAEIDGCSPA